MAENGVKPSGDIDMADCDQEKVVTMVDVLQEQEAFEEDANAVLGASDDQNCTYSKGYVKRQAIYACLTCCPDAKTDASKRAGVCLACSLHCHENHELVELYTKRLFRCDCGNPNFNGHPCTFTPEKSDLNWDNKYNQNFSGVYCVCHRPYPDPEAVEEEEMLQCIVCEDWLHCNHLEATVPDNEVYAEMICKDCMEDNDFLHDYSEFVVNTTDKEVEVYDPDLDVSNLMEAFKKDKLPNGDAKEAEAEKEKEKPAEVKSQDAAEVKPGETTTNGKEKPETEPTSTVTEKVPETEPTSTETESAQAKTTDSITDTENPEEKDKSAEATESEIKDPEAKGESSAETSEKIYEEKPQEKKTDESITEETKADESITEETKADESITEETKADESITEETKPTEEKENITENADENKTSENKRKLSTEDSDETSAKKTKVEAAEDINKCVRPRGVKRCYKGATFWPANFRQKLCTCGECIDMYKDLGSLFLIDNEDTVTAYEALGKERVDGPASQYEKGLQALSSLDRVQQINAMTEYNNMRDKLLDFLKSFKERKEVVKEEDIKEFFAGMKAKREPDGVYFCR